MMDVQVSRVGKIFRWPPNNQGNYYVNWTMQKTSIYQTIIDCIDTYLINRHNWRWCHLIFWITRVKFIKYTYHRRAVRTIPMHGHASSELISPRLGQNGVSCPYRRNARFSSLLAIGNSFSIFSLPVVKRCTQSQQGLTNLTKIKDFSQSVNKCQVFATPNFVAATDD